MKTNPLVGSRMDNGDVTEPLHVALWQENADLARACLGHPFVQRLADGSLPAEVFARYVAQDVFYLKAFFRAYAVAAARCEDDHGAAVVLYRLMGGVIEELDMHQDHAARLGVDLDDVQPCPATRSYVDFLMDMVWNRGLGATITAMTPCMRLYAFLGQGLADRRYEGHPFGRWIDAYSGDVMEELAGELERLLDRFADDDPETRRVYRFAMQCELDFFTSAIEGG